MTDEHENLANELASRWLDDETARESSEPPPETPGRPYGVDDRRCYADQLFVDAILHEAVAGDPASADHRVTAVLARLDEEAPVASGPTFARAPFRRQWIVSVLSVVAAVAGLCVLWVANEVTLPSALAAVEHARREACRPIDRHYQVVVDLAAVKGLQADLFLRGADQVALEARGPLDFSVWIGSDGNRAWIVPRVGPVVVAHDFERIQDRLAEMAGLPVPLLKITHVLEALSRDYDLEMAAEETVADLGGKNWRHVRAAKRPGFRPLLPKNVQFWADPQTGDVGKMILDWSGQVENLAVHRIEFQLVDKSERAPDWYGHDSHHDPDRPVLDLVSPDSR